MRHWSKSWVVGGKNTNIAVWKANDPSYVMIKHLVKLTCNP